jgi:hypothetical protein
VATNSGSFNLREISSGPTAVDGDAKQEAMVDHETAEPVNHQQPRAEGNEFSHADGPAPNDAHGHRGTSQGASTVLDLGDPIAAARAANLKQQIVLGWRRNRELLAPLLWELKLLLSHQGARDGHSFEAFLNANDIPPSTVNRWLKAYRQQLETKSQPGDSLSTSAQMGGSVESDIDPNADIDESRTGSQPLRADPSKVKEFKNRGYTVSVRIEVPASVQAQFWSAAKAIKPFLGARSEHESIYGAVIYVFRLFEEEQKRVA